MFTLIEKLHRTGLLTLSGFLYLLEALLTTGINLMAMLRIAARLHPGRTAVIDERERITFLDLWRQAEALAVALHLDHGVRRRQKVAVTCRNHSAAIKTIFAASRLGAHVFLVNPEMRADQILALHERLRFDFSSTTNSLPRSSTTRPARTGPSRLIIRPAIPSTGCPRVPAA